MHVPNKGCSPKQLLLKILPGDFLTRYGLPKTHSPNDLRKFSVYNQVISARLQKQGKEEA